MTVPFAVAPVACQGLSSVTVRVSAVRHRKYLGLHRDDLLVAVVVVLGCVVGFLVAYLLGYWK